MFGLPKRSARIVSIGGIDIASGNRRQVNLPITDLSIQVPVAMPVHIVNGRYAGPRLFVSAAVHGDEINGVEIIRRLIRMRELRKLRGILIAAPIVNVPGFLNLSRYLPDRRDLNRIFPGSATGSLGGRIARIFMDEIVGGSDFGIDLHTASIHRVNYPQIRVNVGDPGAERIARAFGAPLVLNAGYREGSLRAAAREVDVPVAVYEAGEALRFDEAAIRAGVNGIVRVMRDLAMLPRRRQRKTPPDLHILRSSRWLRAPCSGILRTVAAVGAEVRADQLLGIISDPLGESETRLRAPGEGVVIGRTNLPLVHEGDALFHIAATEGTQIIARALDDFDPLEEYETGVTAGLAKTEAQIV